MTNFRYYVSLTKPCTSQFSQSVPQFPFRACKMKCCMILCTLGNIGLAIFLKLSCLRYIYSTSKTDWPDLFLSGKNVTLRLPKYHYHLFFICIIFLTVHLNKFSLYLYCSSTSRLRFKFKILALDCTVLYCIRIL